LAEEEETDPAGANRLASGRLSGTATTAEAPMSESMPLDPAFKIVDGRPVMKASYVMKKDPNARMAYRALRGRGVSREKAEALIEAVSREAFITVVCHAADYSDWKAADPRPECWFLLAEGLPVERIFLDLHLPTRPQPNLYS
jgi:hypothetical protein